MHVGMIIMVDDSSPQNLGEAKQRFTMKVRVFCSQRKAKFSEPAGVSKTPMLLVQIYTDTKVLYNLVFASVGTKVHRHTHRAVVLQGSQVHQKRERERYREL